MKKLLSMVLVVAMLASMLVFAPAAGATETIASVEAGAVVGAPGQEVKVPVTVTASVLSGFSVLCEFDGSRLEYVGPDFAPVNAASSKPGYPVESNGDPVFDQWYENGSFISFSWASAIAGGEDIASEGLLVAYMIFKVKDDAPVGDAYVKIHDYGAVNDSGNTIYGTMAVLTAADDYVAGAQLYCGDGKVTVLPEGWLSLPASNEDDFTISAAGALTKYTGLDDVVVIPSTVTSISKVAFNESTVKTVVIPASVETIAKGAFLNCREMTDVYILGGDTVLEDYAMGFEGSYNVKKGVTITGCLYADEDCLFTVLNIHSVANENVLAYAQAGDCYVDEETGEPLPTEFGYEELADGFVVSFGGASAFAPATTVAPGSAIIDGKTVVAWKNGDVTVAPGAALTLTADTVLEPISVTAPVSNTTVALKVNANVQKAGIRFTATLSKADYAEYAKLGNVKLGMLITPAAYVAKAGAFTKEALDAIRKNNATYVDIAINGYFEMTETDYTFAGHMTNFSGATYQKNPNFVSVMYATITINGVDVTVYSAYDWAGVHNIETVAGNIIENGSVTDTVRGQLELLLAEFSKYKTN